MKSSRFTGTCQVPFVPFGPSPGSTGGVDVAAVGCTSRRSAPSVEPYCRHRHRARGRVGLVMGIVGVSDGLTQAQNKVLSPLSSVGTDIIVTRTVGATTTSGSSSTTTTTAPTGGGFGGGAGGGGGRGGGFFGPGAAEAVAAPQRHQPTERLGPSGSSKCHFVCFDRSFQTRPGRDPVHLRLLRPWHAHHVP